MSCVRTIEVAKVTHDNADTYLTLLRELVVYYASFRRDIDEYPITYRLDEFYCCMDDTRQLDQLLHDVVCVR